MKQKIVFLGDLFYDYDYIAEDMQKIASWIKENNYVTIVNLEGVICNSHSTGVPIKKRGPNLHGTKTTIDVLKALNVKGVCLANNHMMDFGKEGLEYTIECLDSAGIKHTGAGKNIKEALKPMEIEVNNQKVRIFNYGWDVEETVYAKENLSGCAPRINKLVIETINDNSQDVDKKVVCMHWGFEYNRLPMPYDIDLAHTMIYQNIDLIIGHHPHNIQPKEDFENSRIYYSLGNFYFGSRRSRYKRIFKENIKNQSDYGLIVIWDIENGTFEEKYIVYDHEKKESSLSDYEEYILENISNVDYNGRNYYKSAKKRKLKINPILGTDELKNKQKIQVLYNRYKFRAFIKKLIRR